MITASTSHLPIIVMSIIKPKTIDVAAIFTSSAISSDAMSSSVPFLLRSLSLANRPKILVEFISWSRLSLINIVPKPMATLLYKFSIPAATIAGDDAAADAAVDAVADVDDVFTKKLLLLPLLLFIMTPFAAAVTTAPTKWFEAAISLEIRYESGAIPLSMKI